MNDPTKRIDVEKSSLLSLKAELLRKQEEVQKSKLTAVPSEIKTKKSKIFAKESSTASVTTSTQNKDSGQISAKTIEYDDSIEMAKVRRKLEAKAKYYDQMVQSKDRFVDDGNSLILFDKKKDEPQARSYHHRRRSSSGDENELVDYVDIFGRSRKIARKDLDKVKRQDEDLSEAVEAREEQAKPAQKPESDSSDGSVTSSEKEDEEEEAMIGPDIGLQFKKQREQWEEQDELNRQRVNLHYQDVLFDGEKNQTVFIFITLSFLLRFIIIGLLKSISTSRVLWVQM